MPTLPCLHFSGQCPGALTADDAMGNGTDLQAMRRADRPVAPPA